MQCKPVAALPAGEKWTFQIKLDGYHCISRHKKILNRRFLDVVRAIASLEGEFVLDGELVALD